MAIPLRIIIPSLIGNEDALLLKYATDWLEEIWMLETSVQEFPSVSGQSYIITWADDTDNLWKFVVYNHDTGQLSSTHVTNLIISDWALNDDERAIQSKGFSLEFQISN